MDKKLSDAAAKFQSMTGAPLSSVNSALQAKNLPPLKAMAREEWDKK
jgi:hypothetical protein